MQVFRGIL